MRNSYKCIYSAVNQKNSCAHVFSTLILNVCHTKKRRLRCHKLLVNLALYVRYAFLVYMFWTACTIQDPFVNALGRHFHACRPAPGPEPLELVPCLEPHGPCLVHGVMLFISHHEFCIVYKWSDGWPMVFHTRNLCSAFNPSKCTHTHREHTPGAVGNHFCCGARGAVSWFGALLKGFTSVVLLEESTVHRPWNILKITPMTFALPEAIETSKWFYRRI